MALRNHYQSLRTPAGMYNPMSLLVVFYFLLTTWLLSFPVADLCFKYYLSNFRVRAPFMHCHTFCFLFLPNALHPTLYSDNQGIAIFTDCSDISNRSIGNLLTVLTIIVSRFSMYPPTPGQKWQGHECCIFQPWHEYFDVWMFFFLVATSGDTHG